MPSTVTALFMSRNWRIQWSPLSTVVQPSSGSRNLCRVSWYSTARSPCGRPRGVAMNELGHVRSPGLLQLEKKHVVGAVAL